MATGHTDQNGFFEIAGSGGDPFGGDPDVYVRVVFTDDAGVRLTAEANNLRAHSTPEHAHDNTSNGATINFGMITAGAGAANGNGTECGVFDAVRDMYRDYVDTDPQHMPPPAGYIDIEYWSAWPYLTPWTNTDTIHWPTRFRSSSAPHEFGHSVRHAADGNSTHFTNDVTAYRYARTHDDPCDLDANAQWGELLTSVIRYNFNEGWAHYWAGWGSTCPWPAVDWTEAITSLYIEGVQLTRGLTRHDMVSVLRRHPGEIHEVEELQRAVFEDQSLGLLSAPVPALPISPQQWVLDNAATLVTSSAAVSASTPAQRQARLRASLKAVRDGIQDRQRAANRLLSSGRNLRASSCNGAECEAVFNAIVAPVLLQGEARALTAYESLLVELQSNDNVERAASDPAIEMWITDTRRRLQQGMQAEMVRTLDEADAALARARQQMSHAYELYAQELAQARAAVQPSGGGGRGNVGDAPLASWAPQFGLPEDALRGSWR